MILNLVMVIKELVESYFKTIRLVHYVFEHKIPMKIVGAASR